jgi:transcriptional regulator with GAF, ATPase, and Fis domain
MTTPALPRQPWPPVYKTKAMILCEHRNKHNGTVIDIRDLILNALTSNQRDSDAAYSLGILHTTLSHWIQRLGIHYDADRIRSFRNA